MRCPRSVAVHGRVHVFYQMVHKLGNKAMSKISCNKRVLQSKFNDLKTGHLYNTVIPIDIMQYIRNYIISYRFSKLLNLIVDGQLSIYLYIDNRLGLKYII